jgi:spore germination cell wall hydrolase CwlJ-like protein
MTYLIDKPNGVTKRLLFGIGIILAIIASIVIAAPAKPTTPETITPVVIEKEVSPQEVASKIKIKITPHDERQIHCLARNAYFEAGNQTDKGMIAVTNVVMNRVEDGRFPRTPCAVINQRTSRVCQFSWVCEGKKSVRNMEIFRRARAAAERVYLEETPDVTHGSLFYHANYVNPRWNLQRVTRIGAHIFYRDRG